MLSSEIIQPTAIMTPFAVNGDKNIPNQTASGTKTSSINNGFLPITSEPLEDGGIAPERIDFNGMFYLATDQRVFLQNGGIITYDENVAQKIGGYPQGAILGYVDSNGNYSFLRSTIDNNQNNFITNPESIGTSWVYVYNNQINKSRTLTLTGSVTGTINYNLASSNIINISTKIGSNFNSDGISRLFNAMTANFSAGISKATSTTHTADTDGFIAWQVTENDSTRNLTINGVIVARARAAGSHDGSGTAAFLPVAKGSTYYCNKGTLTFYPLNGV